PHLLADAVERPLGPLHGAERRAGRRPARPPGRGRARRSGADAVARRPFARPGPGGDRAPRPRADLLAAAGAGAAVLAVGAGGSTRRLDVRGLQTELLRRGFHLGESARPRAVGLAG